MKVDEKILARLQELIALGQKVLNTRETGSNTRGMYKFSYDNLDRGLASQWGVSCLSLIGRVFGKSSDHYVKFESLFSEFHKPLIVIQAFGILKAAKDDYENGYLFETRTLIEAEVFDDLLEQAEYLFNSGYYLPAAVMAGGVLEDALKKLCERSSVSLPSKPTIDPMNVGLAKAGLYSTLVQKKITALADIRNKAAHGKYHEFSKDDVKEMIAQVRSFMEKYYI